MRTALNKFLAITIIIVTTLGLILGILFLVQTWRYRHPMTVKLQSAAKQTSDILGTTEQGLELIDQIVVNVYSSTNSLQDSATALAQTVDDSSQFFGSAGNFMGQGLINTITNTQSAIDSAQASAVVIDNILQTLSNIPFVGINYNPSRPLNVALGEVSASLDPLQSTLKGFENNLKTTQTSMQGFKDQILILNQDINAINKNLKAAELVIKNYQTRLKSLQTSMDKANTSLPGWVTKISWVITGFILWLMLIQVAIILQAVNVLTGDRTKVIEVTNPEISPP